MHGPKRARKWFNPAAKAIYRAMKDPEMNRPLPVASGDPKSEIVVNKTSTVYKALLMMQREQWGKKEEGDGLWRGHIASVRAGPKPRFKRKHRLPKKGRKAA